MPTKVTILPNGPALIAGDFELIGTDGKAVSPTPPQVAICRCGQSNKKPFCDGSHKGSGFKDPAPPVM